MGRLIFLMFLLLPLIEIATFITVGQAVGLWPTLLGVVLMGLLGVAVIRVQGVALLMQIRATVERGQLPARQLADAMLIGVAGVLLVLPGFFSDVIGLTLLIPQVRTLIYRWLQSRMVVTAQAGAVYSGPAEPGRIRDAGVVDLDEEDWRTR